jgi:hypothetical protein
MCSCTYIDLYKYIRRCVYINYLCRSDFTSEIMYAFLISLPHATSPVRPILLDLLTRVMCGEECKV